MADAKLLRLKFNPFTTGSGPAATNFTIDSLASIDRIAWAFEVPQPITISHVAFRYGTRVSGTTPVAHKISLQSLDSSGLPSGTILGGGSPASAAFTPPADASWDGTVQWLALDNAYTAAAGEEMCLVVEPTGDPATGPNTVSFTRGWSSVNTTRPGLPYSLTQTNAAAWAKDVTGLLPVFGIANADPVAGSPTLVFGNPIKNIAQNVLISTAAEQGAQIVLPSTWWSTYKIAGVEAVIQTATAAAKTLAINVWDNAGTPVSQQSKTGRDADVFVAVNSTFREAEYWFASPAALTAGSTYNVMFGPESASQSFGLAFLETQNANDMMAFPGGTNFLWASRAAGGATAFTLLNTRRPLMELILADITAPAGGGTTIAGTPMMRGMVG